MPNKKEIPFTAHALIILTCACLMAFYLMWMKIEALEVSVNSSSKVAVVDMEGLIKKRLDSGEEPAKVIRYSNLLAQVALEEGYIVLEKSMVLASSKHHEIGELSIEDIEARLKARGVQVLPLEHFQKIVEKEQRSSKTILDRLMEN